MGLEQLGLGNTPATRRYRVLACGHELEAQVTHVRRGNVRCQACGEDKIRTEARAADLELIGAGQSAHQRSYRFIACGHEQELHVSAVRDRRLRCRTCLSTRLDHEAADAGLILVGAGHASRMRRYRFIACGHVTELPIWSVRLKQVRCAFCARDSLQREAAKEKLILIGPGHSAKFKRYRFLPCGHERELRPAAIRHGYVRCQVCFDQSLANQAEREQLTIIGRGTRSGYRIYRFEACGHERELFPGAVRRGHVRCKVCLEAGIAVEAKEHGLALLGPGRNSNYRLYRFDECGHERQIGPSQVRRGAAFCRTCLEASLADQARAAGVELVGRGKPHYRRYRFKKCGHEQEMQPIHVRLEGFHCQICNESAWHGEGNVYVVTLRRGDQTIYKVGLAKSVEGRITRYGLKDDVDAEISFTKLFPKYRTAHKFEQKLHAELRCLAHAVDGKVARQFLTSGFTECFRQIPEQVLMRVLEAQ